MEIYWNNKVKGLANLKKTQMIVSWLVNLVIFDGTITFDISSRKTK